MAMEGLGRVFNSVPTGDGVWINMRDSSSAAFVLVGADTYTLQEATDAAGTGAQDLATIDRAYTNAGAVGATTWVETEQTAAATIVVAANAVIHVHGTELSDDFDYIAVTAGATGAVQVFTYDLVTSRNPENLRAVSS